MGEDVSSHQCFAGAVDAERCRAAIIAELRRLMGEADFREVATEEEADRSFVIGPPGRWIHVGDSAGSTDCQEAGAFEAASEALSFLCPVVDIRISDSAVIYFDLYRNGQPIDSFGNGLFPFFPFETAEQAEACRGKPELWVEFLLEPDQPSALQAGWDQSGNTTAILMSTAALLGWHPDLVWVGYSNDNEGIFQRYDDYLLEIEAEVDLAAFEELHFQRHAPMARTEP